MTTHVQQQASLRDRYHCALVGHGVFARAAAMLLLRHNFAYDNKDKPYECPNPVLSSTKLNSGQYIPLFLRSPAAFFEWGAGHAATAMVAEPDHAQGLLRFMAAVARKQQAGCLWVILAHII